MKILLVQLPTSHFGAGEKVYPLGLSRLSSLIPESIEKQGLDMNIHPDPWKALKDALSAFTPDIIALSFRNLDPLAGHGASYLSSLKTAAELIRTIIPHSRIIAGGPAFSLFAKRLMEAVPQLDIGIVGEAEPLFEKLLEGNISSKTPGLIRRVDGQLYGPPDKQKKTMDMNDLPPMDRVTFQPGDYTKQNAYVAAVGIEGKRGCDLWCGYCLYPFLGGRSMRLRDPKLIVDEMEVLKKEHGINLFHFTDPVVNRPEDHFEQVCRELTQRRLDVSWTGFFREDGFTPENLDLAVRAGLCAIYFSGDALTNEGLKLLNKGMSVDDLLQAARMTADAGILTMCHFLLNLPGDDAAQVEKGRETLEKLLAIHAPAQNLGAVIFNTIRLYPGAPLTRRLISEGKLDPELDLLYPVYHNPPELNHVLHDFEALCHKAGVFSQLGMTRGTQI